MKYTVTLIYLLLLLVTCLCNHSNDITYTNLTLNHTFTHQLTTKDEYFISTLTPSDLSYFDILLLETTPFNHNNPSHIYISQLTSIPSNTNYTLCSNTIGTNRLYIYTKDIDHSLPLYVYIKCTYNCLYNITATLTNKLVLHSHSDEIHYTPHHSKTFFYYTPTNASVDINMYIIGDRDSNFIADFVVYNATSNEIVTEIPCMNVYYEGCGNIIPITSLITSDMNVSDIYIEAAVVTDLSVDEPQGVKVGVYVEDVTQFLQPLQRVYGIIDNNYIKRMCFDVQEFQQWPPTKLLFYYELYTHGIKVEFFTQPGEEVFYSETILNNNYTLFNSSLFKNSYFCLTTPDHFDKDDTLISFIFTYTYTSETEFTNAQAYLPPLVSGVFYHFAIPKDRVAFFRRKNAPTYETSTVNANVIKLKENIEMYPYVCTSFPYCTVTKSMIHDIRTNSVNISSIYTMQNQISIEYNASALSPYEYEKIVFVLYCNSSYIEDANTYGCEFIIEIDNSATIELLPNVKFIERHRQKHDGFAFRFSGTYSIASLSLMVDNIIGYGALTSGSMLYTVIANRNVVMYNFTSVDSKRLYFAAPPQGKDDSMYALEVVVDKYKMNVVNADYLGSVLVGVVDGEVSVDVEFGSFDVKYGQRGRYIIDVVSAGCVGNVKFDDVNYNNIRDVEVVFDDRESDYYVTSSVLYLQVVSMDSKFNNDKERCMFHVGVVNEYNVNGLQLKENEQFTFRINDDIPQRVFNYIISLPNDDIRSTQSSIQLMVNIKHTNKELTPPIPLTLQVATNTVHNVQKTFLIFNTTTLMLSSPLLSTCNTNTHLCHLYLTISANYTSSSSTVTPSKIIVSLLLTHQTSLPMYIEKQTVYKLSQTSKKQAMYLYTTLTSVENGEAIFNFNTQPEIYGGVFAVDEQYGYGWMGNIPLDKNNINKIPFNSYTQSIKWSQRDLMGCINGCYLILMLCLNDDNERYNYVNEFTVEINTVDVDSGKHLPSKVMLNEVIERTIEKDGDVVYYYFTVNEDAERLVITLNGLNAVMYIKQALNTTPSETNYDWKLNTTETTYIDITSKYNNNNSALHTLRDISFTLAITLSTYVTGSSKFAFQITPQYDISPIADYFPLSYSDHEQCMLSNGKNTCNFIIHIPYGYNISFFGTYAESTLHPFTLIETYATVYSTAYIQSHVYVNGDDIFNYFPRGNYYDHKSTPYSNALEIFTPQTAINDVYVFISLTTINQVDDVIDFYTSNISPINNVKLTQGGKRLFYYDNKGIGNYEWNVIQYVNATSIDVKRIIMEMRVVKGNAVISKRDDDKNVRKYVLNGDSAMLIMDELNDEDGKEKQMLRIENDVYNDYNSKMILGSYSYNVVNRVEMVNVNVASLFYFEEHSYPLYVYSKVNCNGNCNDIIIQLNFMWNRNISELNSTLTLMKFPFEVNVYNVNYPFINKRLGDNTVIPPSSAKINYNEVLQSFDVYVMNVNVNDNAIEYLYIEITQLVVDGNSGIYAQSELNVLISSHNDNSVTCISQGKYYYSLYDVSNTNNVHLFAFTPFYDNKLTHNELYIEINESLLPKYKHTPPLLTYTLTEYGNYSHNINMMKIADTNGVNVFKANIISNTTTYKVVLHVENKHDNININDSKLLYSIKFYTKQIINDNEIVNAPNVHITTRNVNLHYNEDGEKVITFTPVSIASDSVEVFKPIIYKLLLFNKKEVNAEQFITAIVKDVNRKVLPQYEFVIQSNTNDNSSEISYIVNDVSGEWNEYDTCLLAFVKGDYGMESILNYREHKSNTITKIIIIVLCILLIVISGGVLVMCIMKKRRSDDDIDVVDGKLLSDTESMGNQTDISRHNSFA